MPVRHRGTRGAYLIGDQTVWSAAGGGPGTLSAFAQLGVADARVNRIGGYVGGGFTRTAPLAARPQDVLGLAVSAAQLGSHARRATAGAAGAETTLELTYACQLTTWVAVQPDVQYVVRPSGLRTVRNAWAPGLRIAVSR